MESPPPPANSRLALLVRASAALAAMLPTTAPEVVLAALYEQAADLFQIRNFVVSLYDRDAELIRCGYAVIEGVAASLDQFPSLPLGEGPTSRVIRSGLPVIVPDIATETSHWNVRMIGDGPPVRSMLLVPMTRGGEVVGVVQAQSSDVDAFTADDAAALSVLANQTAAALEGSRQREQAERAAARARLLDEVGRALGESLDLREVLDTLAGHVNDVMGAGSGLYLLDEAGVGFEAHAIQYRDPVLRPMAEVMRNQPPPPADSFIGRAILRGRPLLIADLQRLSLPPGAARTAELLGVGEALIAPIRRQDRVLGAILVVGTHAYPLHEDDLTLASALANRAAAAVEHARLHAAMADQGRFLAHLIEAAPIGIAVLRGADHVYEVANAEMRTYLPALDPIGRTYLDANMPGDERGALAGKRLLEEVGGSGRPQRVTDQPGPPRDDGSRRFLSIDLSPLPAGRGRPAGVLMLTWDSTSGVLARERLQQLAWQSEAHAAEMDAIIAGMVEGVLVTSADGTVRLVNEAGRRIFGASMPPIPFRPWDLLGRLPVHRQDGAPFTEADCHVLWEAEHPLAGVEMRFRAPDSTDRVLQMNVAPIPRPDGERAGAVATFEDVTHLRLLEESREEFLAQASHELRTPLTSLLGYLQMAERRLVRLPGAPAAVTELVESAVGQAQRLRQLVTDLLDTSRIRQGRLDLRREPVDLTELLTVVVTEQRETDSEGLHTLHLEMPDHTIVGTWDRDRLRQVLQNLLENAMKYSPLGGNVWARLSIVGREAVVRVEDEGIGIPESEIPKLFRPFGRADHPRARNIPGFGLGLYICRDIIERHDGTISIVSQLHRGTTVTIALPYGPPDTVGDERAPEPPVPRGATSKRAARMEGAPRAMVPPA